MVRHDDTQKLVNKIYRNQIKNSRKRGHKPPGYSLDYLSGWLHGQNLFYKLINDWEKSNYNKELIPSVDRIDNSIGYTKENIQLMTFSQNRKRTRGRFISNEERVKIEKDIRNQRDCLIKELYHNQGYAIVPLSKVFNLNKTTIYRIVNS